MSILESIRDALAAVLGGTDPAEETPADDETATPTADDRPASDPTQLDPDAVTETRAGATDDAVDALRSLRQPPVDAPDDGTKTDPGGSGQGASEADVSEGQHTTGRHATSRDGTGRAAADPGADDRDANH